MVLHELFSSLNVLVRSKFPFKIEAYENTGDLAISFSISTFSTISISVFTISTFSTFSISSI